jgi:hypothetical protein
VRRAGVFTLVGQPSLGRAKGARGRTASRCDSPKRTKRRTAPWLARAVGSSQPHPEMKLKRHASSTVATLTSGVSECHLATSSLIAKFMQRGCTQTGRVTIDLHEVTPGYLVLTSMFTLEAGRPRLRGILIQIESGHRCPG